VHDVYCVLQRDHIKDYTVRTSEHTYGVFLLQIVCPAS
jgi:hypothetical protein